MSAIDSALCFGLIRKIDNERSAKVRSKLINENDIQKDGRNHSKYLNSNSTNQLQHNSSISGSIKEFPSTPHSVLLIQASKDVNQNLNEKLLSDDVHFKTTDIYSYNKMSFRFIISNFLQPDKEFYDSLLPYKRNL